MLINFKNILANKNNWLKLICFTTLMLSSALQAMNTDDQQKKELNEQLLQAAVRGNTDLVAQLLDQGADINAKNRYNETALTGAAAHGKYETCKLLITRGANVNARNRGGRTALINAASAAFKEICELLIGSGADVNTQDHRQVTALGHAALLGYQDICKLLIDAMLQAPINQAQLRSIILTPKQKSEISALFASLQNIPVTILNRDAKRLIVKDVRNSFKQRNFIEAEIVAAQNPFKQELLDYLNSRIEQQIKEGPQMMQKK